MPLNTNQQQVTNLIPFSEQLNITVEQHPFLHFKCSTTINNRTEMGCSSASHSLDLQIITCFMHCSIGSNKLKDIE